MYHQYHTELRAPRVPSAEDKPFFSIITKQMIDSDHFFSQEKTILTLSQTCQLSSFTAVIYWKVYTLRRAPEIGATYSHICQVPTVFRV